MGEPRRWTREELLLVLHLYERIPFGQQHQGNPEVVALAAVLARTPGSVAMKLNNLTSLDPAEQARGVRGLAGASELDRQVWSEFHAGAAVAEESEELWETRVETRLPGQVREAEQPYPAPSGPTDAVASRRIRLGQRYFRRVVLANFNHRCALTGLAHPELLNASHISPWAEDAPHRLDAANGLCLNKLHDAAFDRKLLTFDNNLRLVVGRRLRNSLAAGPLSAGILEYEGVRLSAPVRRAISRELMEKHRAAFAEAEAGCLQQR